MQIPDHERSPSLAMLLHARNRARNAFRTMLLSLQAAAQTPEGVTGTMEDEARRLRDDLRRAESDLDAHRGKPRRDA